MALYAKYDAEGNLLGILEMDDLPESVPHPFADDDPACELVLDERTRELSPIEIIDQYRVDPQTGHLYPKAR